MRIGIDIRSLQNESRNRGIGTYTRSLIKSLLSVDKENEYVFFVFKNRPLPEFLGDQPCVRARIKAMDFSRRHLVWAAGQVLLPLQVLKEGLDLYHSPEFMVPVFAKCAKVLTVHDFIYRDYDLYDKISGPLVRRYYYLREQTFKRADRIIAVSEYTKRKISELTGVRDGKVKVIHEAVDGIFRPRQDEAGFLRLKEKYGIKGDFLLYAGAIDYHKNIEGLIKAFSRIKFKDTGLVLAGVRDCFREYLNSVNMLIERLKLQERVRILGHVSREDLAGLYNMARIVISVSFYEGFGLPVLEAMSCARPVIASGNTSMAEIVGPCGALVDPYKTEEISAAMENLLSDRNLCESLSRRGLERSKEFSWERAAQQTLSLYNETAGAG